MEIDGDRLREDIEATAEFGTIETAEGRGRTVLTGTDVDRQARDYFVDRLEAAGLDVRVDAVGNVVGRWCPPGADADIEPVAAGSHLDSVPEGGIFDGPLGVYAALEAVRAMQEADVEPDRPVDVVSFTEEEGQRFSNGLLGSSVAVGKRSVEEALALEDEVGTTLAEGLDSIGYRGTGRTEAVDWDAWLELHVEQDTRLERQEVSVGVVTTITGITQCGAAIVGEANHAGATPMPERTDALAAASEFVLDVERAAREVVGEANHAGATPMPERTDALAAASEFVLDVERAAREVVAESSETAVATVGTLNVSPNATNVVPGAVELEVDIRDVEYEPMNYLVDRARGSLARLEADRGVETSFEQLVEVEPTPMADRCLDALRRAGERADIETMDMHSQAGHDTMHVADVTDAAMLFAPSRDGISHSPREWTDWDDCAAATRVLAGALAGLAGA